VYDSCSNLVYSNHAISFHFAMLTAVTLFVTPFETMNYSALRRFDLSLHYQIMLTMVMISTVTAVYLFATREEGVAVEKSVFFGLLAVQSSWAVSFTLFGFHALNQDKKTQKNLLQGNGTSSGHMGTSTPIWNKIFSLTDERDNNFSIAPMYRYVGLLVLLLQVVISAINLLFQDFIGNHLLSWLAVGMLPFHAITMFTCHLSDIRRPGYPYREALLYVINPLFLSLNLFSYNKTNIQNGFYVLAPGLVLLLLLWKVAKKFRENLAKVDDESLAHHVEKNIFKVSECVSE